MPAVNQLYENKRVHLIVSGDSGSNKFHKTKEQKSVQFGNNETFGVLTIDESKAYTYKQFSYDGAILTSFTGQLADNQPKGSSKERNMAIIVLICSMAFLCYFIYSWISCYIKKPKVKEPDFPDTIDEDEREFEKRHTMSIDTV